MNKPKQIFRVRNTLHKIEGEYSEKELARRIHSGQYTGEEEVSAAPFSEWKKISAHPRFYDLFIARVLGESSGKEPSILEESVKDFAQKKENVDHTKVQPEIPQSLEPSDQPLPSPILDVDTQHKAEIDKLFEPSVPRVDALLSQPLDHHTPDPVVPSISEQKKRPNRQIYLAVGILGVIFILFISGKSDEPVAPVPVSSVTPVLGDSAVQERKEVLQSLLEEAEHFLLMDSTAHTAAVLELVDEALGYDSENLIALKLKAEALGRLTGTALAKSPEALKEVIAKGRRIEPHASIFYLSEALEAFNKGDFRLSKEKAQQATEADPTSFKNKELLAEILLATNETASARILLEEVVQKDPTNTRASYLLAKQHFSSGNLPAAQSQNLKTLGLNEMHANSYVLLADILSAGNHLEEAKSTYFIATKLGKFANEESLVHAYRRLSELYEVKGRTEDAAKFSRMAELIQKKDGLSPEESELLQAAYYDKSYYLDKGQELIKTNKYDGAVKFFQAVQVLYPQDGEALVKVADAIEKTAYTHESLRRVILLYQRAILKDPENTKAYVNLAVIETEQYNFERAKKLLEKAEQVSPENADVFLAYGRHYFKRQDFVKARDYFSKAVTINPTSSEPYYYYGLLTQIYKKENVREAQSLFHQAYTLDPHNYLALAEWLKLRVINFEKTFAVKFIRALIEKDPTNANLYWILGEIYAVNKEQQRAISYYHKSLDLDNRSSRVRVSLAQALVNVGETAKAVEEYRLASQLDRRNGNGYFEAANLLFEAKEYVKAEENLKQLLAVLPNYPGARRNLARVYQALGKQDASVSEMQAEVDNNPENYKFVIEFAEIYMSFQMFDKAIGELTKVTALPNETKAPQFKLERIRAYLLLSRSLRELKKGEDAEGAIRAAIAIDPNDPELHRELGYVYLTLQRDKEATTAFNYYLSRNPAAQDAENIKSLIQKLGTED